MNDKKKKKFASLVLQPGKFYLDREGSRWCCFKVSHQEQVHCRARCVRVSDDRVEYFYLDGRYDEDGRAGLSLVRETK
jgi:hypothetical protein